MKDVKAVIDKISMLIEAENGPKDAESEKIEAKDVESFLSENFEFTGSKDVKGQVKNKTEWLSNIPRPDVYRELHDPHDIVPESEDIAIINSIVSTKKTDQDNSKSKVDEYRNIHVFIKENGDWCCNYWQVTKLETPT